MYLTRLRGLAVDLPRSAVLLLALELVRLRDLVQRAAHGSGPRTWRPLAAVALGAY